jgi:agmatinase
LVTVPTIAPGVSNIEPGEKGFDIDEAVGLLRAVRGMNIVGGDVVEVAPQYDASTNTAQAGAQMLFEILSLMAFSPACKT